MEIVAIPLRIDVHDIVKPVFLWIRVNGGRIVRKCNKWRGVYKGNTFGTTQCGIHPV
jgi:hypothetical protein